MVNAKWIVADFAAQALRYEVSLTPKPGLVDPHSSGAHRDMDYTTFTKSIASLRPFFVQYVQIGLTHQTALPDLFLQLRALGQQAESEMLKATDGINTHKGAHFSFALLLGATGFYLQKGHTLPLTPQDTAAILTLVREMTATHLLRDFQFMNAKADLSHGERLFVEQGFTGIRGEAANGYPTLADLLLPFLRQSDLTNAKESLLQALLFLMSQVKDSNLLHRGGEAAWLWVKEESRKIHEKKLSGDAFFHALRRFDQEMIVRYLSPGGSADLLSLGIFFLFLESRLHSPEGLNV